MSQRPTWSVEATHQQEILHELSRCPRGLSGIEFSRELMEEKVLVVPGEVMGLPGYIRLSLTCSDDMVAFALPVFERLQRKPPVQTCSRITNPRAGRRRSSVLTLF